MTGYLGQGQCLGAARFTFTIEEQLETVIRVSISFHVVVWRTK